MESVRNASSVIPVYPTLLEGSAENTCLVRELRDADVDSILALHSSVRMALASPELYRPNTREFYKRHVGQEGQSIGIFVRDVLVAFVILRFARWAGDNLGRDLGVTEDMLSQVVHIEECAVRPGYRGRGFQRFLTRLRLDSARRAGFRFAASTVAPGNVASLSNLLRCGLSARTLSKKYGGYIRLIMCRDLQRSISVRDDFVEWISVSDVNGLSAAFAEGLIGVRLENARLGLARGS